MLNKLKIWHLVFFIWLVLVLIRIELLIQTIKLFYLSLRLSFNDYNFLSAHLNFQFFDSIFSLIFILIIPILLAKSEIRKKTFGYRLTASNSFIVLLTFCFLVPSLITRQHPDFQQNISELKLLPPFSTKYRIELKSAISKSNISLKEEFIEAKEKVLLKEFDDKVYYLKNYSLDNGIYNFISGSNVISISADSVQTIKSEIILLGADEFGRDIFARLIFGARNSIFIGIMAVIISLLLGLVLGFVASTGNPILSLSLNRLTDLFLSFPSIFLVILILALFGNNLLSVIIVLGFSGWMSLYKIVSSEVATIKRKDYFITAQKIGLNNRELLIREVIPVIIIPVTVNLVFQFSNVILAESALSFLGLGSGNQFPSWGAMIEQGQEYIYEAWWMIFVPGITLVLTLLSIHNIAKELNKFFNPKIG